jgi:hypothetical protein
MDESAEQTLDVSTNNVSATAARGSLVYLISFSFFDEFFFFSNSNDPNHVDVISF